MSITIKDALTPINHGPARPPSAIQAVVVHVAEGTVSGTISHFRNPDAEVSSHYLVGDDGTIYRIVPEEQTAWTNGWDTRKNIAATYRPDMSNPLIARWANDRVNPNGRVVTLEMAGWHNRPRPPAQLAAVRWLVQDICRRHGLPLDRTHVIGHYQVDSVNRARCPSLTAEQWSSLLTPERPLSGLEQAAARNADILVSGEIEIGPGFVIAGGRKGTYTWCESTDGVSFSPRI